MGNQEKLNIWADKLLDLGKKNNLISYKDTKSSSAELIYPECDTIFSKCSIGHVFEVFDPKLANLSEDGEETGTTAREWNGKALLREEYKTRFQSQMKSDRNVLIYAQTPNPLTAVKNIAKTAKSIQDETGINVAYLAFGFVKWKEKDNSTLFYKAPLLLVHVNVLTGSIVEPVKIEVSDDDVVVNPTFNYLLRSEYGIELPDYHDTETLTAYLAKVEKIVGIIGWEVVNECKLGTFSFLKINMYEDLRQNADKVLQNDNIKILLGDTSQNMRGSFDTGTAQVIENPLIELHTVVDADSSQIEAIEMAKSGKSFVLQGPPGTGKSQTITNIIAECLYDGKTVLFVSEKQAALNVVFDKLKKAKLEDFCLELHSHKANKKTVIEELNRTLELPKIGVADSAAEEIRQKETAQKKLDGYASALHTPRKPINKSLYQLFEAYSSHKSYPDLSFHIQRVHEKGQDYLDQADHLLEQYAEYVQSVGQDYHQNAWYGFTASQISFDERTQLKADLELLCSGFQELRTTTMAIREKYETGELNFAATQRWQTMLAFVGQSDVVNPLLLTRDNYEHAMPYFREMRELSEAIVPLRNSILTRFSPEIIREVEGKDFAAKLTGQFRSAFSRVFSGEYKSLLAKLQPYANDGKKPKYAQAVELSQQLAKIQSATHSFEENETKVKPFLGKYYRGPDTDWAHVLNELEQLQGYFSEEMPGFGSLAQLSVECFSERQTEFQRDAELLEQRIHRIAEAKLHVNRYFSPDVVSLDENSYAYCVEKLERCLGEYDKLGNWISFTEVIKQINEIDLLAYVDEAIEKQVAPEAITGAFRKLFYRQWIEFIAFSTPEISSFSRINQDQAVQRFAKKDQLQYEISKAQIRAELSSLRPSPDLVAGGSAVALLRREANKKRKQYPIRRIMSEAGNLVQILKPCFLMSPLSVSTYLDPEKNHFDTVIFDEASQIFPQDAIGAIYRGNQLIVVGDSRQMPPSDFFNVVSDIDTEDEELGDVNNFESILDVCSAVFSTKRLAWHYRSHYEQLIAFSNLNFYHNHLVTFPSATTDHKGIGVDFYHVEGVFDRESKSNRIEAEFVVDLIYQNIQKYPNRSLGVVAFSTSQQSLIDKILAKRRMEDPSYEWFFNENAAEPFFIKNLETVQGDERDTIIFSVAYSKDSQGKFYHNFGPLNRSGGERRLNVAVTRAKDNVQLVASIHYTDINLNNSKAEGTRLLRAYLDYAENGSQALDRALTVPTEDQFDSYFEQEVCDYLRDNGFTVDTQVGCSGFRIDIGLRKPDSSDYLLAIECDGATYHRSKNARDRDCLRQRVLENMGWKFYRIWSTDWYRNQMVEKERLLIAVKEAVSNGHEKDRNMGSQMPERDTKPTESEDTFISEIPSKAFAFQKYKQVDAMGLIDANAGNLRRAIRDILLAEAPLSEEYLLKRIVSFFDRAKVTSIVQEAYNRHMCECTKLGIIRKDGFLYLYGMEDIKLRVPGDRREPKYIAIEELAAGLQTLMEQNITTTREGLFKKMTTLLGFTRMGDSIMERLDEALGYLSRLHLFDEKDGFLTVTGKGHAEEVLSSTLRKQLEAAVGRREELDDLRQKRQRYIEEQAQYRKENPAQ